MNVEYVFLLSSIPFAVATVMMLLFHEERKKAGDIRMLFRYDRPGRTLFSLKKSREFLARNRNLLIFTISTFILMLSSGMVYSYLSLLLGKRFGEGFVGTYYGMDGVVASLLIYPFGYLADRIGSKVVIVFGSILYIATFYLYYTSQTMEMIIFTAVISGTKWAFYFNSINTYVSRMSSLEERATALGMMNSAIALGWVLGPLMGAYIISLFGLAEMMLLATIPVIVSLAILVPFTKNDVAEARREKVNNGG